MSHDHHASVQGVLTRAAGQFLPRPAVRGRCCCSWTGTPFPVTTAGGSTAYVEAQAHLEARAALVRLGVTSSTLHPTGSPS